MKLQGIKILPLDGCAEFFTMPGLSYTISITGHKIAMHEIDKGTLGHTLKNRRFQPGYSTPAHMRDFHIAPETLYPYGDDPQAGSIALLGVLAHKLHTQTDTQQGLLKLEDQLIQPTGF